MRGTTDTLFALLFHLHFIKIRKMIKKERNKISKVKCHAKMNSRDLEDKFVIMEEFKG